STFVMLVMCTVVNGAETRRRYGKSIRRQVGEQISVAVRHSIAPPWYYFFGLWDDAKRAKAHLYIQRYETKGGIFHLLRSYLGGTGKRLNDKLKFHKLCSDHGLPAPSLAMVLRDGAVVGGHESLPEADLFVKPLNARGGIGGERWDWIGDERYRSCAGEERTRAELLHRLAERSRKKPLLVQLRLHNHPDVAEISAGALSTSRLMTVLNENGEYESALAVFRTSADPRSPIDNYHAHGLVMAVDLATGELGRASGGGTLGIPKVSEMIRRDTHPVTGARITGRRLPFWSEAKALAEQAHAAVPGLPIVGWDIAFTPDGPVIVEGNSGPDVDVMQVAPEQPLGETRVAAALAHLVRRAEAELHRTPVEAVGRSDVTRSRTASGWHRIARRS
ncbi:unnamed protein product, partial [marine sediment metagenome]